MNNLTRYYHAMYGDPKTNTIPPTGYYEAVEKDTVKILLHTEDGPIYARSKIEESCFAKTPEGAILGLVSGDPKKGRVCTVWTTETPDVDISDDTSGDFWITEEVRYRRTIETKPGPCIEITGQDVQTINKAYGDRYDEEEAYRLKEKIRRRLSANS